MRSLPSRVAKHAVHTYCGCLSIDVSSYGATQIHWQLHARTVVLGKVWVSQRWLIFGFCRCGWWRLLRRRLRVVRRAAHGWCSRYALAAAPCVSLSVANCLSRCVRRGSCSSTRASGTLYRGHSPQNMVRFYHANPRHPPVSWCLAPWVVRVIIIRKKRLGRNGVEPWFVTFLFGLSPFSAPHPHPPLPHCARLRRNRARNPATRSS